MLDMNLLSENGCLTVTLVGALGIKRRMSPGSALSIRNLQPLVRHIFETCGLKGLIG